MTDKCQEDLDVAYKLIPIAGFIMFVAGLAVGKYFPWLVW